MTGAIIRKAKVEDAYGIATVHVKMWQQAYRGLVPDAYLDVMSIERRKDFWQEWLAHPDEGWHMFVAKCDGIIAGWVMGGKNRDEDVDPYVGELGGIYMHPAYAGKGIGSKLMDRFLQALREDGYTQATLWVLDTNVRSRKWYESKSWRVEGKTKTEPRQGFELHEVRYRIDLRTEV